MGELKSCPFCGSLNIYPWDDGTKYPKHRVVCPHCSAEGAEVHTRGDAIAEWNTRTLTPAQQAAEEMAKAAQALADAMETCHECKGTVLVDEQPTHCEDCSWGCDSHDGAECATLYSLHLDLKRKLAALAKAGKP